MVTKTKRLNYFLEAGGFFKGSPTGSIIYLKESRKEAPIAMFGGSCLKEAEICEKALNNNAKLRQAASDLYEHIAETVDDPFNWESWDDPELGPLMNVLYNELINYGK